MKVNPNIKMEGSPSKDYLEAKEYLNELKERIETGKTERHFNFFCFMYESMNDKEKKSDTFGICDDEDFITALAQVIAVSKDVQKFFKMAIAKAVEIMDNNDND